MVTEIYPTLPPNCCYLNMFTKKNSLFSFLNNSRKPQAATYYVKVYNFQTSLGCYGPSKVKNELISDLLKKIQQVGKKVFFEFDLPKISQQSQRIIKFDTASYSLKPPDCVSKRKQAIFHFEHIQIAAIRRQRRVNFSDHNSAVIWPIILYTKNSNFKWEYLTQ